MGLFDRFKKKQPRGAVEQPQEPEQQSSQEPEQQLDEQVQQPSEEPVEQPSQDAAQDTSNAPGLLMMALLFKESPSIDSNLILNELKRSYPEVTYGGTDKSHSFYFPGITIEMADAIIPAQCNILIPDAGKDIAPPDEAYQQNWHWPEAAEEVSACKYEFLITDLMSTALDYTTRQKLYLSFLVAVIRATHPDVVYSVPAQKLIPPDRLVELWDQDEGGHLVAFINVRMYSISNSTENDTVMDTIGLHTLGLPDLQIRFTDWDANIIGGLLWSYAYYIFENGDIIQDGNTFTGPTEVSRWKCQHEVSLIKPVRWVINVKPK